MLFEIALDRIGELKEITEIHLNMERNVLIMEHRDGAERIYVADLMGLKEAVENVLVKNKGRIAVKECATMIA